MWFRLQNIQGFSAISSETVSLIISVLSMQMLYTRLKSSAQTLQLIGYAIVLISEREEYNCFTDRWSFLTCTSFTEGRDDFLLALAEAVWGVEFFFTCIKAALFLCLEVTSLLWFSNNCWTCFKTKSISLKLFHHTLQLHLVERQFITVTEWLTWSDVFDEGECPYWYFCSKNTKRLLNCLKSLLRTLCCYYHLLRIGSARVNKIQNLYYNKPRNVLSHTRNLLFTNVARLN